MGTITKALDLLGFFSLARPEIALAEMVRLSGRDKATVHRHLVELTLNGLLEQNQGTRAYRLGPTVLRLAGVRESTHPTRSILMPIIQRFSEAVGELVHVSLLQGGFMSPVCHADQGQHGTRVFFDESVLLPIHATSSGLACLAFSPERLVRNVLSGPLPAITPFTCVNPVELQSLIRATQQTGLCCLERAYDVEVVSLAAPVFSGDTYAVGAIAAALTVTRASAEHIASIAQPLVAAARAATQSLGGTYPPLNGTLGA